MSKKCTLSDYSLKLIDEICKKENCDIGFLISCLTDRMKEEREMIRIQVKMKEEDNDYVNEKAKSLGITAGTYMKKIALLCDMEFVTDFYNEPDNKNIRLGIKQLSNSDKIIKKQVQFYSKKEVEMVRRKAENVGLEISSFLRLCGLYGELSIELSKNE